MIICSPGTYGVNPGRMKLNRSIHCGSFSHVPWPSGLLQSLSSYVRGLCVVLFHAFFVIQSIRIRALPPLLPMQKKCLPNKMFEKKKYIFCTAKRKLQNKRKLQFFVIQNNKFAIFLKYIFSFQYTFFLFIVVTIRTHRET